MIAFDKTRSYERNLTVVGKSRFPWKRAFTTWPLCLRSFFGICQNLSFQKKFNLHSSPFNVSVFLKCYEITFSDVFLLYFFSGLKNTQDQIIHLQHIIQLLPLINRDTLYVLLQFLGLVAENAEDRTDEAGKRKHKL